MHGTDRELDEERNKNESEYKGTPSLRQAKDMRKSWRKRRRKEGDEEENEEEDEGQNEQDGGRRRKLRGRPEKY